MAGAIFDEWGHFAQVNYLTEEVGIPKSEIGKVVRALHHPK